MKEIKKKKCIVCDSEFMPYRTFDKVCSILCHKKAEFLINKPKKKRKRINGISEKRKYQRKIYLILRENYLKKNPNCERCSSPATEIHHKNGRTNDKLVDVMYFMASCRPCHTWIHNNPQEAREAKWLE